MPKQIAGSEYICGQPTNFSEIKEDASYVTFANYSLPTIPKEALEHLSQCKTLVFINTGTSLIERNAWLGLNNLESLSIEGSSMRTVDTDMFAHLKSLTTLKVTTIITGKLSHHPMSNIPVKRGAFRGLDSLKSLWLTLPNLNELTFRSMDHDVWVYIADTLTELMLPDNSFTELYDHMFIELPCIKKLSFRNNGIVTISSRALNGLVNIKEIDLAKNKINEIAYNTFQTLPTLIEINLSENNIERLRGNLFKGLKKLKILKLNDNRLETIGCDVFDQMDFLRTGGHPGKMKVTRILGNENKVTPRQKMENFLLIVFYAFWFVNYFIFHFQN